MDKARIILEPYDEGMFDEFVEVVMQDNFLNIDLDNPKHVRIMRENLAQENSILMAIRDASSHEFLGYCDAHDTDKHPWELGIKLLERHWGKGIGYGALKEFLPILAEEHKQTGFIAQIAPDNLASIRLFQKLGATPREVRRSMYMLDEGMVKRFAEEHSDLIDDTVVEMASLFGVEPEYLLGRVLVFDVPAEQHENGKEAQGEKGSAAEDPKRRPSAQRAVEKYAMRGLMDDLIELRDKHAGVGDDDELDEEFARLREKHRWMSLS